MPHHTLQRATAIEALHRLNPEWSPQNIRQHFIDAQQEYPPSINGIKAVLARSLLEEPLIGGFRAKATIPAEHVVVLQELIDDEPRQFLNELADKLTTLTYELYSEAQISHALKTDLNYTRKMVSYYARQRELQEQINWMEIMNSPDMDVRRIICIDESHAAPNFSRPYGWGPSGEDVCVPRALGGGSYSFMAACNCRGMILEACQLLNTKDCAIDGDRFIRWVCFFRSAPPPRICILIVPVESKECVVPRRARTHTLHI